MGLTAEVPDTIAGEPFEVQSYCAITSDPGGLNTAPEFLEAAGVDLADVTVLRSAGPDTALDPASERRIARLLHERTVESGLAIGRWTFGAIRRLVSRSGYGDRTSGRAKPPALPAGKR